jgi:peptidoglycan hydrolase CwlO-like protein
MRQDSEKTTRQMNQDVRDIVTILDDQDRICADMQSTLKHQHRHIQDLQSSFETLSHNYEHALNTMSSLESKANKLCHEIDAIRHRSTSRNSL